MLGGVFFGKNERATAITAEHARILFEIFSERFPFIFFILITLSIWFALQIHAARDQQQKI
jgi:hypothetical protein